MGDIASLLLLLGLGAGLLIAACYFVVDTLRYRRGPGSKRLSELDWGKVYALLFFGLVFILAGYYGLSHYLLDDSLSEPVLIEDSLSDFIREKLLPIPDSSQAVDP